MNVKDMLKKILIKYWYKEYIKICFKRNMGYKLNLEDPKTINEKLQWLKTYYRDSIMTQCADKYGVREIVENSIGKKYLIETYGIYKTVDEIDFDKLPNQFVLKPTHSSGKVIICKDKSKLDIADTKNKLEKWLKENYYYQNGEWVYKDIKPQIICEKLLDSNIKDYKFYFFHGVKKMLLIVENRYEGTKSETYFDENNKKIDMKWGGNPIGNAELPSRYNEMIKESEILAKRFPFVRVDWYEVEGRIYFGELTFFPANGMSAFEPESWDYKLGEMLDLKRCNKEFITNSRGN